MANAAESPKKLNLSVRDAAIRLGVGRSKIYEEISSKRLLSIRIGARRLIPEAELYRYQAAREAEAASA